MTTSDFKDRIGFLNPILMADSVVKVSAVVIKTIDTYARGR